MTMKSLGTFQKDLDISSDDEDRRMETSLVGASLAQSETSCDESDDFLFKLLGE